MRGNRRVLFPFVGDSVGGSHISALTLVKALAGRQFEPRVAVHWPGSLEDYLVREGLQWERLPSPSLGGRGWGLLTSVAAGAIPLARYLRSHSIDIVHTNDARMHCLWLAAAKLAGVKHLWHQRALSRVAILRKASRFSDRIVAISRASAAELPTATIVPNPVARRLSIPSRSACRSMVIEAIGVPPDSLIVCWTANWTELKRPLHFIELAHRILSLTERPVSFLMIGEPRPPVEAMVRERIRSLHLDRHVHVLGTKWPIEPWIAGAGVLVSTAVGEAFGRTLVEAMLVGTPVVASASAGHLEIVDSGRTGWLVPPDDLDEFAATVLRILEEPSLAAETSNVAQKEALEAYSLERHVEAIEGIYNELLRVAP